MGCCNSRDDQYDDDDDDDVLVYPINGVRNQPRPPPQIVTTRQPPLVSTRTSFLILDPSHLPQNVTTSRPPVSASSRTGRVQPSSNRIIRGNCEACGQSDHLKPDCRYRNRLCFYCREEGHIISVCPNKRRKQNQPRGRGRGRTGPRRNKY